MMGERRVAQEHLFYEFSLERHVPETHLLRSIDRFVELGGLRRELAPFYSEMGRPSIDPELLIRMLIVGYCFGIRSERRLCEEVHLNLAYRWFCRLGLDGSVPDHSSFSKNRHGRFRDSDLLRRLFETVLQRCIDEGLVGGEGFAVDASLIQADASDRNRVDGAAGLPPDAAGRAVKEYLAIIVDVEATTAIRQAEILAAKRMIERSLEHFDLDPERLIGDTAYGSAEMLNWLVHERGIEPHIPVFDKSQRTDGTFSREDFTYDHASDAYRCPAGKTLQHYRRQFTTPRTGVMKDNSMRYRASKRDCQACALKPRCCPNAPARKISRSIFEGARDLAREIAKTDEYQTSRRQRKKVEMLFAHLKRILKLDRLRLRGPSGARDEFHLAATAQNLRKLAKLIPMPSQLLAM